MGASALCGAKGTKHTAAVIPMNREAPVGASTSTVNIDICNTKNKDQEDPGKSSLVNRTKLKIGSEVLKTYEPKALIGKGSFSKVVAVEKKETGNLYALKMVKRKHIAEYDIETELNILKQLDHPYVVHLYETIATEEQIYMILELAEGGEVYSKVNAYGPIKEREAKRIIKMVLEGVQYLHQCGITHRDLKLENLLYKHATKKSDILISDFGLAHKQKKSDDIMTTTCGTSEYLAPEVLEGDIYTNAVDLWAIGVITYVLLSGKMPFEEDNKSRLYHAIVKGDYNFKSKVSIKLHECIVHVCVYLCMYVCIYRFGLKFLTWQKILSAN